ncbi:MAG: 2-C-methyl-D-erythritol 4-phosphate cytidylyltransferase [Thermodesulfobacteriota bacterium]
MHFKNFAIIVAAGKGLRMGAETKKQYLCLDETPILTHTIMAFDRCDYIHEIILVIPENDKHYCRQNIIDPFVFTKNIHIVKGGKKREDSVSNGLKMVCENIESLDKTIVMIHDGVRPFVDDTIIKKCIDGAIQYGACIPAVKVTDTIKQVSSDREINSGFFIQKTINRESLYSAQTPQTFKLELILKAFDHAKKNGFSGTDDASLIEYSGHNVYIEKGSKINIKITTPEDLVLGEYLLALKASSA